MEEQTLGIAIAAHLRDRATELQTAVEQVLTHEELAAARQAYPAWQATHVNYIAGQPNGVSEWLARMVPWARSCGIDLATMLRRLGHIRDALVALCSDMRDTSEVDLLRYLTGLQQDYALKIAAFYVDSERESLAAERRKLRAAGQVMSEAVVLLDLEGEVAFVNPAAAELLGQREDALLGQSLLEQLPEPAASEVRRALRQRRGPYGRSFPGEVEVPGASRRPVEFSAHAVFDAQGRRDGVALVIRPVQTHHADLPEPLATLMSKSLGLAIQLLDSQGRPVAPALLPEAPWAEGLRAREPLCQQLLGCERYRGENCRCAQARASGTPHREHTSAPGLSDRLLGVVTAPAARHMTLCIAYDAALRLALESPSRTQQRSSLAAQLAVAVAHQLRNPLGVIIGSAERLNAGLPADQMRPAIDKLLRNSLRCREIITDLAEYARTTPEELAPTDLRRLIVEQVRPFYPDTTLCQVDWDLPERPWVVQCAPEPFAQVVGQLLDNALQSGAREVRVALEDLAPQRIRLCVSDDGPGIPPTEQPRIFQPFYSTRRAEGALGLGLSLAGTVVQDLGGKLYLDPAYRKGARFVVELPRHTPPVEEAVLHADGSRRILLVDDEVDLLELMQSALVDQGFQVDAVATGEEAVPLLGRRSYAAIVLDVQLPGELGGREVFAAVERLQPSAVAHTLFVTADTMNFETRRFLDEVGRPYLEKPFLFSQFVRKVVELAAGTAASATGAAVRGNTD